MQQKKLRDSNTKNVGIATINFGKEVFKNLGRALEIASKIGSPAATKNSKAA